MEFWGNLAEKEVDNGTNSRKIPPRSVDDRSFGIPDFEPLLNSHQAAQLLDIHQKTLQSWRDVERFTAPM